MKGIWWKLLAVALVLYAIIGGLLMDAPRLPVLNETIRNLYFHVTMWFGMMAMLLVSLVFSIASLATPSNHRNDLIASEAAYTGIFLGTLGIVTGSIWAQFTWGAFWTNDPKLNGAAITMLVYIAYVVLRNSLDEEQKRARIAAVYNIFAFVLMFVFIWVLPRMTDSLHPGNGGNPAFSDYDLDDKMRMIFYPAVIGWALIGWWIANIRIRIKTLQRANEEDTDPTPTLHAENS